MRQAEFVLKLISIIWIAKVSAVNVKLTNLECRVLAKQLGEFQNCSIKAVKRDVTELNVYIRLQQKPLDNITITLRFARHEANNHNNLYQYTINACEFFRNKRRNPLAVIFYSFLNLEKYSNLNHTCPFDHDLIVDRCQLNMQPLSVLSIVKGGYKIFTTYFVAGLKAAEVDLSLFVY